MKSYMKKLTRAIPCFVAVLSVVLAFTVQASATAQYIDPYKYIKSVETSGSIETVQILFDGVQPLHRLVAAGNDFTTSSDVTFTITPGMTNATIASWQNGVQSADNQPAPDGAIRVAEIMAGTTMVIKSDFGFSWSHGSSGVGGFFDITYQCFVRCYDADGNYMTRIAGERLSFTEQLTGGAIVTKEYDYSFNLPSGCVFICPSSNFTMYPRITSDDAWGVMFEYHSDYFGMTITRDSIAADSALGSAVNEKLDTLINGSAEDQSAANASKDKLQGQSGSLSGLVPQASPNKPNINSVDTSVDSLVSASALSSLTSVITPILENELIVRLLLMSATLMFVSLVLYGKKE